MSETGEVMRAIVAKEKGIQRAIEHANRVEPSWQDQAYGLLVKYATIRHHFQTEHVRLFSHAQKLPDPPDARAWGAIMRDAARNGLLQATHYAPTASPISHRRPAMVWKSTIYRP